MPDQFVSTPALGLQNGHFNQALTNLLMATPNGVFVANRVFPVLPVQKQSDAYFIFDAKQRAFALSDDRRAPGTLGNTEDYAVGYDVYRCEDHALHGFVTAEEMANYDAPLQPLMDKVFFLGQKTQLNEEYGLKATLDANLTQVEVKDSDGNVQTIDTEGGQVHIDLYEFINAQITAVRLLIGRKPNCMLMDDKVFKAFQAHPSILERIKYTGTGDNPSQVTAKTLAELFGLDEILIPDCVVNTAKEGQDPSNQPLWGKDIYIFYRAPQPALKQPSIGYTLTWANPHGVYGGAPMTPAGGTVGQGWVVESWVETKLKREDVRVSKYYVQKLTMTSAGLRIINAIA